MQARFDHRDELLADLGTVLREAPATEWVRRLRPLGIAVGEVVGLADALDGDLVRSRGMVVSVDTPDGPLRMVGNPIRCSDSGQEHRPPPRLHEHTGELLKPPTQVSDQAS
jgi:CoA:oxalate CoA-transferase